MASDPIDDGLDEVIDEFLIESSEGLDQLDRDLVDLEQDPADRDRLGSVFRTLHTIKGTSGFLGFSRLEALSHAAENLLVRLRDGTLVLDPPTTTVLLETVDAVRRILQTVEAERTEGQPDHTDLIARLAELASATDGAAPIPAAPEPPADTVVAATPPVAAPAPDPAPPCDTAPVGPDPAPAVVHDPVAAKAPAGRSPAEPVVEARPAETTVRVDVGVLDELMNLVGELVLARNQILQLANKGSDAALVATSQRLNLITSELQEGVTKTRMQPIGNVWSRFPRVVRDLAVSCGKQVRLELEGTETELDRTILEAIRDPMIHLLRNSVDHGIERADVRVARGKQAEGRLLLQAYHEGGYVNIQISDDGGGLDVERIRTKAMANERRGPRLDAIQAMSDSEAVQLIFEPGFSTSETVTNVSGRGVGLDVVRTHVENVGGVIDVVNRVGEGVTFKIRIPLTLAIVPALIVTDGCDRYAIPQVSLVELVRAERAAAIEEVAGASVYRLRGRLLPIVDLASLLSPGCPPDDDPTVTIVVLQTDSTTFGLAVRSIQDTEEIVVKPVDSTLIDIPAFSGATIMGDGRVALILDVAGLARLAGLAATSRLGHLAVEDPAAESVDEAAEAHLIVRVGQRRLGIPLPAVDRLDEIDRRGAESAQQREVVRYRDRILPLLPLAALSGQAQLADVVSVVIVRSGDAHVGLVVDEVLDIVEEPTVVETAGLRPGVRGSTILAGHITDLVDVEALVASMAPEFAGVPA